MIHNHSDFLDAIHERKLIRIDFYSKPDDGNVHRECAPLDFGPDFEANDLLNRYWIWDPANTAGANPLGLLPGQITKVQVIGKDFDPGKLPLGDRSWFMPRKWATRPELATRSSSSGERMEA